MELSAYGAGYTFFCHPHVWVVVGSSCGTLHFFVNDELTSLSALRLLSPLTRMFRPQCAGKQVKGQYGLTTTSSDYPSAWLFIKKAD